MQHLLIPAPTVEMCSSKSCPARDPFMVSPQRKREEEEEQEEVFALNFVLNINDSSSSYSAIKAQVNEESLEMWMLWGNDSSQDP